MIASMTAKTTITASLFAVIQAVAGGFGLYEIGTAEIGLAAAGYAARAQDASTVVTNRQV